MTINKNTSNKRISLLILIIFLKTILEVSYIYYINPIYSYEGFTYNMNYFKLFESYVMTIIIVLSLPLNERKPSSIAFHTLNIFMLIPVLSLYALKDESRIYIYMIIFSFLLSVFIVKRLPKLKINIKFSLNAVVYVVLTLMGIIVYGSLIFFNGIPTLELLDFSKVYAVRGTVNYGFPILDYLVPWQGKIINVFFLFLFWIKKEKKLFMLVAFLQLLLYLITSHKVYFFYPIVIPFLIYFINHAKFMIGSIVGMLLVVISSLALFLTNINTMVPALFINRTLFLPAQISFQYHEYFSENGLVLLSHSIFEMLFDKPVYDTHPILLIGERYYADNWANTGYLGDAYMNFGYVGMIVFSIIFAFILIAFDSLANSEGKRLISSAFIVLFMLSFSNGALLTNLLTNGILFYLLLLIVFKDNYKPKLSRLLKSNRDGIKYDY